MTFRGGSKGRIVGKRIPNVPGLPTVKNVLYVEELMVNFIRISQLCDDDLQVKFKKDSCEVCDGENIYLMNSQRLAENCYMAEATKVHFKYLTDQLDRTTGYHQL